MPRIEKYTESIRQHGDWLSPDFRYQPGEFITFLGEDGKPNLVCFLCPCGCGSECPTRVVPAGASHTDRQWEYRTGGHLIHPSVRWESGCLAHFYINEDGTVTWA